MNASPFPGTRLPEPDGAPDTPGVNAELMRERAARTRAEAALHANEQALDKMAHDMRNQFNALASAVEVLKSADTKSSLGMRALAIIARQTRQLSELLAALPAPSAGSHSLAEGVAVDPDDGAA